MNLKQVHYQLMKNPKFREEWYKPNMLGIELSLLRIQRGFTQRELAVLVGTKQAAISRAENSDGYLSLDLLHRIANALGYYIKIEFKEKTTDEK